MCKNNISTVNAKSWALSITACIHFSKVALSLYISSISGKSNNDLLHVPGTIVKNILPREKEHRVFWCIKIE